MSLPTYVTVPFERTMIFASASSAGSSCAAPAAAGAFRRHFAASLFFRRQLHHPAARVFARRRQLNRPAAFQHLERRIPEFQMQRFRSLASASRNQSPADPACANGSARSPSRRSPPSPPLRRGPLRCPSASARAIPAAPYLPPEIASRAHTNPSRHNRISAPRPAPALPPADFFSSCRNPSTTSATCTPVLSI